VTLRPRFGDLLDPPVIIGMANEWMWYPPEPLLEAGRHLHDLAQRRSDLLQHELGHDLVAVVATLGCRAADWLLVEVIAVAQDAVADIRRSAARFLDLLTSLDELLDLRTEMRLDTWETAAMAAVPPDRRPDAVRDLRRLISMWNDNESGPLTDYSARLWSGVITGLYRRRWAAWLDLLVEGRATGSSPESAMLDVAIDQVTREFIDRDRPQTGPRAEEPLVLLDRVLRTCEAVLLSHRPRIQAAAGNQSAAGETKDEARPRRPGVDTPGADRTATK
jgi:hypothetical protein